MSDALPRLAGRVRALEDVPVAQHPDELEAVHRLLAEEVDRVGRLEEPDAGS